MLPNMNPKQMEKMLKQMGINSREITAKRVTIETENEKIVISEPQITEITAQGQKSFQIQGKISIEAPISADHSAGASTESSPNSDDFEDDVKMVAEQAGCSEDAAREALKKSNGDIAQAILELSPK